ncbi:Protein Aster-C [Irineochytrium annulatum]|nr:Protein Aster-C [Irineochytrium annulatum]
MRGKAKQPTGLECVGLSSEQEDGIVRQQPPSAFGTFFGQDGAPPTPATPSTRPELPILQSHQPQQYQVPSQRASQVTSSTAVVSTPAMTSPLIAWGNSIIESMTNSINSPGTSNGTLGRKKVSISMSMSPSLPRGELTTLAEEQPVAPTTPKSKKKQREEKEGGLREESGSKKREKQREDKEGGRENSSSKKADRPRAKSADPSAGGKRKPLASSVLPKGLTGRGQSTTIGAAPSAEGTGGADVAVTAFVLDAAEVLPMADARTTSRTDSPASEEGVDVAVDVLAGDGHKRVKEFKRLFPELADEETLVEDFICAVQRPPGLLMAQGRMYICSTRLCFYSSVFGVYKISIKFEDIESLQKHRFIGIPNAILVAEVGSHDIDRTASNDAMKMSAAASTASSSSATLVSPQAQSQSPQQQQHLFHNFLSRDAAFDLLCRNWTALAPSKALQALRDQSSPSPYPVEPTPPSETPPPPTTTVAGDANATSGSRIRNRRPRDEESIIQPPLGSMEDDTENEREPPAQASLQPRPMPTPTPIVKPTGSCPCTEHESWMPLVDESFPIPLRALWDLLFSERNEFRRRFLEDDRRCQSVSLPGWTGKGQGARRTVEYVIPLGVVTPRTRVEETIVRHNEGLCVCVQSHSTTPQVYLGDHFRTAMRFCMSAMPGGTGMTRVRASFQVEFVKNVSFLTRNSIIFAMRPKIVEFHDALCAAIKAHAASAATGGWPDEVSRDGDEDEKEGMSRGHAAVVVGDGTKEIGRVVEEERRSVRRRRSSAAAEAAASAGATEKRRSVLASDGGARSVRQSTAGLVRGADRVGRWTLWVSMDVQILLLLLIAVLLMVLVSVLWTLTVEVRGLRDVIQLRGGRTE